jgi:hypothetical protein
MPVSRALLHDSQAEVLTLVKKMFWKKGTYEKKNRNPTLASIAGGIQTFRLAEWKPKGLVWKSERRRVRVERRLPHCMKTRVKK